MVQDANAAKKRILIIDDEELNTQAFSTRLQRRGFDTTIVKSGAEALALIAQESFHLIILDIVMPEMDGIAVLKTIRKTYAPEVLPVIMATVMDSGEDMYEAFKSGANDYLTKPINLDAAVARINGQIGYADLYTTRQKQKQSETVNAMVITYHHEINNPLAIAKAEIEAAIRGYEPFDQAKAEVIKSAIGRIEGILDKIKQVAEKNEFEFERYTNTSKMLKLTK